MGINWDQVVRGKTAKPIGARFADELQDALLFPIPREVRQLWDDEVLGLYRLTLFDEGLLAQFNLYAHFEDDEILYAHRGELLAFAEGGGGEPVFVDGAGASGPEGAVYTDFATASGRLHSSDDKPAPMLLAASLADLVELLLSWRLRHTFFCPIAAARG